MPRPSPRAGAVATTAALLLGSMLTAAGPAAAADSPEAAIEDFIAAFIARDVEAATAAVCAEQREAAARAVDVAGQMGLDASEDLLDELVVEIDDVAIEILEGDDETATASVTALVALSFPEELVPQIVEDMLSGDLAPGEEIPQDELDFALPMMESMLNSTLPLEEEAVLVREDGAWLVCSGFGLDGAGPTDPDADFGTEPTVSTEGLCGLVSPAELSGAGVLAYDSSNGFENFCFYSTSDFDGFHSTTVNLNLRDDAETTAGFFEADQTLEVAGLPAFATGEDAFQDVLFVQIGPDSLQVTVSPPESPPEGFDWLAQATATAELFAPHVPAFRDSLAGPASDPTPEPTPEISLCESLPLDELNATTGLGFDEADGDAWFCSYIQVDGVPGWHSLNLSLLEVRLDDHRLWMTDAEELTVEGSPALRDEVQLVIGLPGDAWTLQLSGWIDPADEATSLTIPELLADVAAIVLPRVEVPEPTAAFAFEPDDPALDPFALADEPFELDVPAGPPGPMCDYVDLEAVNALGILEYAEASSSFDELCTLSQLDFEKGFHTLTVLWAFLSLDDARLFLPDAEDVDVAGFPGLVGEFELYVETPAGVVGFNAVLPEAAVASGMVPADILVPVAELVATALAADAGE